MKVLFTSPILEYPAASGPQLRIENSIKALSKICDLHILHQESYSSNTVDDTDGYSRQFSESYQTVYRYPSNRLLRFAFRVFRKLTGLDFDRTAIPVIKYIKDNKIEVFWFGYRQTQA